jgi:lambda repressor-like predicted transcriptional regulator
MNKPLKQLLVAGVLVAAVVGVGVAVAQSPPKQGPLQVAAGYVGLSRADLVAELREGQSLAQVAVARGKSREGLVQALLSAFEQRLDARGVSAERKQELASRARQRIERLVDRVGVPAKAVRAKAGFMNAAAAYIGVTKAELRAELPGKSLAQVAASHGKSADGLKQALLGAVKARLDKAVVAGNLAAARRDRIVSRLEARLDRLINRIWPQRT